MEILRRRTCVRMCDNGGRPRTRPGFQVDKVNADPDTNVAETVKCYMDSKYRLRNKSRKQERNQTKNGNSVSKYEYKM